MKKIIPCLPLAAILLSCTPVFSQQLPVYSQYMFNTLEINPAYAGFRNTIHFTSMFRKEFNGIDRSPQTAMISADMPVGETNVGVGLKLVDERFSVTKTTGAQTAYSYKIRTGDYSNLYMGLQAGVLNYRANLTNLNVTDPNDPVFSQNISTMIANFGAGVYFSTEQFYVGLSTPNLIRAHFRQENVATNNHEHRQSLHAYLQAGYVIYMNDNFVLKPSFLLRGIQGIPIDYDVNANAYYRDQITFGFSYRTQSALVGLMDFKVNDRLRLGYAYDYNMSRLNRFTRGTHEVMIRYQIPFWKDLPLPSYLF